MPCSVNQRPIRRYPDLYRGSVIFVDFSFQCRGTVTGLEFWAQNIGPFYLSMWRPSASGDSWTLIGFNLITAVRRRRQVKYMYIDIADIQMLLFKIFAKKTHVNYIHVDNYDFVRAETIHLQRLNNLCAISRTYTCIELILYSCCITSCLYYETYTCLC